ncbi:carboxypeptidase regulatory-like domain-containing protein [Acidobacteriota bacterium]
MCQDSADKPLSQVVIQLTRLDQDWQDTLQSDKRGNFHITGLPPGRYSIRFEKENLQPQILGEVYIEPSQTLYIEVFLSSASYGQTGPKIYAIDYMNNLHQTVLNEEQIHLNPSAHNVWSLIENQDFSATTNRIDVGGLWGDQPALFGARGNSSWTQNVYLLNGMDVTDPYWTGKPLFYPDFFSLQYSQLTNAGHPPFALSPGGYLNLLTREESSGFTGSLSTFFIPKSFRSTNITPLVQREGIYESHTFDYFSDGNIRISGPIVPGKLNFSTSASAYNIGRDLAEFDLTDESSVLSGLFSLKYLMNNSYFRFLWTGQTVSSPSYGAGRNIPFSSTNNRKDLYNIFQLIWHARLGKKHVLQAGLSFALGDQQSDFQTGSASSYTADKFTREPTGTAPFSSVNTKQTMNFMLRGESLLPAFLGTLSKLQYGFQLKYSHASSLLNIHNNQHLFTFNGQPIEVATFNTPVQHEEAAYHLNFYIQEAMTFSNFVSLYFGLNIAMSKGWVPDAPAASELNHKIDWINLSPRFGLTIPLNGTKTSVIKFSLARYFHSLPLHYLTFGNPNSLGGEFHVWNDESSDSLFQPDETGILLRKEGPLYSRIDPDILRPFTDELSLAYVNSFGAGWTLSISGFYRRTKNLIETINTGVPDTAYEMVEIQDIGDDRIPGSHDDLIFNVYNQSPESLGKDSFFLTNAGSDSRVSYYYGLDLILLKKYGKKLTFFLSFTAVNAISLTNPGNSEWENDDGVIGNLYDNPNSLINSEGNPRFDRGYTGRLGLTYLAPLGLRFSGIIKYYDGQPFSRKIIVTGLNQGPIYIQAHPRGKARYEYNRTIDIRIEKIFNIRASKLRIILDGFNITNRFLATEENEWTSLEFPLRFATEIQSPRVFRLGIAYEF